MKSNYSPLHLRLLSLDRKLKKYLIAGIDFLALGLALWSSYVLTTGELWPIKQLTAATPLFIIIPLSGILIFHRTGLYREVLRFMHIRAVQAVLQGVLLLTLILYAVAYVLEVEPFSRMVPIAFALTSLVYVGGTRLFIRGYYNWLLSRVVVREPVLIYGAGGTGVQLATSLAGGADYLPVGFVDDDKSLWNSFVTGLTVYSPAELEDVITDQHIRTVLLALPEIASERRAEIFENLARYKVQIKTMPSMPEIISGIAIDKLREIQLEELLGRTPVLHDSDLLNESLNGKNICITGGGGSIGSEIARQALINRANLILLIDSSEFNLYNVCEELTEIKAELGITGSEIVVALASVDQTDRLKALFSKFSIDTIYHAAAYKHVPIVENNVIEGLVNNAFGTQSAALAALECSVDKFVLVSTDKAVRPTNVMGATKRLAELILQDLAYSVRGDVSKTTKKTLFCIVRFGNVLGSSGSVVPLFKKQIRAGGPVTVTHRDITRYFMTIQEAASLVIQAGAMTRGGEVFVLDMGRPVKIADLAERMIRLSGYEIKSPSNPDGDIEIQYTGLRPGEKLYEELLIGENVEGTGHPKIMRAAEDYLTSSELSAVLAQLKQAVKKGADEQVVNLLSEHVKGYQPSLYGNSKPAAEDTSRSNNVITLR